MPHYSAKSQAKLDTTHQDLQAVFTEVIQHIDCSIIFGIRTDNEQFSLYKKGRKLAGDAWVVDDKSKIVTYKDGHFKKSKHQAPVGETVSFAIDVVPWYNEKPHIRWDDIERFKEFGWFVLGVAATLRRYGQIESDIEWGGNWRSFKDYPHWQIK